MFGKIVSLLGVAAALFLTGCIPSSIVPPFDEKASYYSQEFCGSWVCKTDKTRYDIAVSSFESSPPNAILIQIVETPVPEKGFGRWVPLVGRIIKIREKYFLAVQVDAAKVVQDAQYNSTAISMLLSRFLLLELNRRDSGFDLQFVTFATGRFGEWKPVGKMVKLHDDSGLGIVLNSTQEIQNMLENGEYVLFGDIYHIIRK